MNVSSAYKKLESSYAADMDSAGRKIKALQVALASTSEREELSRRRADKIQEAIRNISEKSRKSPGTAEVPEGLVEFYQTAVDDNSLLTEMISSLKDKLRIVQKDNNASDERCNELLHQLRH